MDKNAKRLLLGNVDVYIDHIPQKDFDALNEIILKVTRDRFLPRITRVVVWRDGEIDIDIHNKRE